MNANQHIPNDRLVGYLYHTITDAERETIDAHLTDCTHCQDALRKHRERIQRVNQEIRLAIDGVNPPARMQFERIAPNLQRRGLRFNLPALLDTLPLGASLAGFFLALAGLWQVGFSISFTQTSRTSSAFPALACFCLMFVSMDQFERSYSLRPRFIISAFLAVLLWLSTAVLGFLNLVSIRDIALIALTDAGLNPQEISFLTILAVMTGAMGFIALVIGGAEFHYKRIGHPSSWKVFIWTIAIQLLVLITPYFLW
jgi:hypothetical protein